ncbi:MAG: cell wall hydrolase [Candidatus Pacebacteria bacterium]|nr:cell wall hydrolase [Candidatus Paceibacterota bacterium]
MLFVKRVKVLLVIAVIALNIFGASGNAHASEKVSAQYYEIVLLAQLIYFEARDQPMNGQLEVARVVIVRVKDKRWPNTLEGVILQGEEKLNRCQFSYLCDGKEKIVTNEDAWTRAQFVASIAYSKYMQSEADAGCVHSYRATYATNIGYFKELKRKRQIGDHIFYCDKAK